MKPIRIALCQITPDVSVDANVQRAFAMVREAAGSGAQLVILPEMFYHPYTLSQLKNVSGTEEQILEGFKTSAAENNVSICTGSMVWQEGGNYFNRSHLISEDGTVLLSYSKCHLFDAALDELKVSESAVFSAGNTVATVATSFGRVGILICYDIRFPEMAREIALQGADLLIVPAVFNHITGEAHWHPFMQTRATENQLFLAAVSTGRSKKTGEAYYAYGHSLAVSPWGTILTEAGEDECIVYADLEPEVLSATRKKLPLLQHRRGDLYASFIR